MALGLVSSSSTAVLSPCSTLNTPGGRPASAHSSAIHSDADGILLGRLEHHGVAGGDGDGEEPHRHHGREVERADDADRAQRLADGVDVDLGRGVLGEPALEQMRDPAGELDDLLAAADTSPSASETTLPCSLVMISASSPLRALSSSRKLNRIAVRLASEVSRHAGNAAAAASITARASSTLASATCPVTSPVAGFVTGAVAPLLPAKALLSIQCEMVLLMISFRTSRCIRSWCSVGSGTPRGRSRLRRRRRTP